MRGSVLKRCRVCGRYGKAVCNANGGCKDPVYYIAYRVNGRQKRETIGTNKKLAEKILAKRVAQVVMGEYAEIVGIKFEVFADQWLARHARPRVKPQTYYNYKNTIEYHLKPAFKGCCVSKINTGDIESFLAKLIKNRNPKTANNILVLIKTMFKHAKKWGHVKKNPAEDIEKYKEPHREMDYLNPTEIQLLLKHSREPYRTIFMTAILTGARKSELIALQWGDVDWNSNTIFVRRSIYWESRKEVEGNKERWRFMSPKSKRSVRAISMSPALKKALEIHRITSRGNKYDLIFCNNAGNPIDPDHLVKRHFNQALSFAGIRRVRFHDLRHSYTSLLIAQGENIKFIQSQLGHASIQTTLDRYGHILPVDHVGVGKRLDGQVFGDSEAVEEKSRNPQQFPAGKC